MQIRHFCKLLLLIATFILLPSCKTVTKPQLSSLTPEQSREYVEQLDHWSFSGKIAFIPLSTAGGKKQSAAIHWVQSQEDYTVKVNTILGINVFSLESTESQATLHYDSDKYVGLSSEQLLRSHTNLSLPLTHLPIWLKGISLNTPHIQLETTENSRISSLTFHDQFGQQWQLNISTYQDVEGVKLPRKILIENDRFKIRLIITQWRLNNA